MIEHLAHVTAGLSPWTLCFAAAVATIVVALSNQGRPR
jgi:hypothetical protein